MSVVAAGVMAGGSIIGGIFGSSAAKREAARKEAEARRLQAKLTHLEENRQEIIDPYANITDLSSMLSNPFANLSVATQATQMQMEQTDIALANTLDTIRQTGGSASIEQQELSNDKQRIAGEQQLQQQRMSEAQRQQQADVQGDQFMFQTQENRDIAQMDRLSNQIGALRGQAAAARQSATAAMTGAITGAFSTLGAGIAAS